MKEILLNPFVLLILLTFVIYKTNEIIKKNRAHKLLKCVYRLIYIEKRNAAFMYFKSNSNSEHVKTVWGKINDRKKLFPNDNQFQFNNLKDFSIHIQDIEEDLTYEEFLSLNDKFMEMVVNKKTEINPTNSEFTKEIKYIRERFSIRYEYLFFENELVDEYYWFSPSQSEIVQLLEFLKRELYITDTYNIWFTKKGLDTLNLPEKTESLSFFVKIVEKYFSN